MTNTTASCPLPPELAALPPTLTKDEAAAVLRVCRRTLDRWAAAGLLPVKWAGGRALVLRSDLLRLIGVEGVPSVAPTAEEIRAGRAWLAALADQRRKHRR